MRRYLLLLTALLLAVPAQAKDKEKKKKVKWKQVVELQAEPTTCKFLENVAGDGEGMFVITNNQSKKKVKQQAKKATASADGNAYFMVKLVHQQKGGYTFEAKTYWCDELPPTVEDDN